MREHRDTALMALLASPGRVHKAVDNSGGLRLGVHTRTQRDDIGVIVATALLGSLHIPCRHRTNTVDLIGCVLFAIARAADDHTDRLAIGGYGFGRGDTKDGIIVVGIQLECAMVDDVMIIVSEPLDEVGFEIVAGVVGGDMNAHAQILSARRWRGPFGIVIGYRQRHRLPATSSVTGNAGAVVASVEDRLAGARPLQFEKAVVT